MHRPLIISKGSKINVLTKYDGDIIGPKLVSFANFQRNLILTRKLTKFRPIDILVEFLINNIAYNFGPIS